MSCQNAFGTFLQIGDGGSPENFTTIANVKDIDGPNFELATEEVTNHSSPGGWREFCATLLDAGELSFPVNFIPTEATHSYSAGLLKDMTDKTLRNFQLVFPDSGSTTWSFAAFVTKIDLGEPVEGVIEGGISLRPSGQPTLA